MRNDHRKRLAGIRRCTLTTAVAVVVPLVALGAASPALATPKGPYAVFSDCPTSTPPNSLCLFGQTTSGEFKIGKTAVPINKTITLQGGAIPLGELVFALIPAKDGNSLSKTELNVPGGLLNIINCTEIKGEGFIEKGERAACKAVFENKTTGVTATTEIVANEHNPALLDLNNFLAEKGAALTLPVRVHLKNPLLGNGCYIGSETSPIQLHLTTGATSPPKPNEPIHGKIGLISEEAEVLVLNENSLVDNAFSVPVAEGCGEFLFIKGFLNSIVDGKLGLPSAAGNNTAILNGSLRVATAEAVRNSE